MEKLIEKAYFSDGNYDLSSHTHKCHQILFLKSGELKLVISDKIYFAKSPCLIFISRLETHSITVLSENYERYYINISSAQASRTIREYKLISVLTNRTEDFCHILEIGKIEAEIEDLFKNLINEANNDCEFSENMQISYLNELLIEIYRYNNAMFYTDNNGLSEIVWQIQKQFEQNESRQYNLSEIAEKYHLSTYYLSHIFKSVTGYPPMQYLLRCRLSSAKRLLADTDLSVGEIAQQVGFSDVSNFSRSFKKEFNCTPLSHRNSKKIKK